MNKQKLQKELTFLIEEKNELGFEMYLLLKNKQIKIVDIGDDNLATEIKNGFREYINERTFVNENAAVLPLSQLDDTPSSIHHYDMSDLPEGLDVLNRNFDPENTEIFNFNNDNLNNVEAYLLKFSSIESNVVLYKQHSQLNLLKQKNGIFMFGSNDRFIKPENSQSILRFSFTMDFLKVKDEIFVYDLRCLEREFKFTKIIIHNANKRLDDIDHLGIVDNIDELRNFVNDKSGAKKVLNLDRNSPVLKMPFDDIKRFVKNDEYLKKRFKFNDEETQFYLHTKASRIYFIKLMNDDYLESRLTSMQYESDKKNEVRADLNNEDDNH